MTLTNYLTQSLVLAFVFTGFGAALVGRLTPPLVTLTALALFAAQLLFSRWWLTRHRYGPVEWLLRAVTLSSRPKWKGKPATESCGRSHRDDAVVPLDR